MRHLREELRFRLSCGDCGLRCLHELFVGLLLPVDETADQGCHGNNGSHQHDQEDQTH